MNLGGMGIGFDGGTGMSVTDDLGGGLDSGLIFEELRWIWKWDSGWG